MTRPSMLLNVFDQFYVSWDRPEGPVHAKLNVGVFKYMVKASYGHTVKTQYWLGKQLKMSTLPPLGPRPTKTFTGVLLCHM